MLKLGLETLVEDLAPITQKDRETSAFFLMTNLRNVRFPKDRTEDDTRQPFLQVSVKYDPYPPNINMITASKGTVKLDENAVGLLDDADIENVDVRIRPYNWTLQDGRTGVKAYVKDMYVTVEEDPFAAKYAHRNDDPDVEAF